MVIRGIVVPTLTFFNEKFEIDLELNSLLFRHILMNGADALFLFGATGEGLYYQNSIAEKLKLIELAYKTIGNEFPVLLGVFGNDSKEDIFQIEKFSRRFKQLNFVITAPYSKSLSQEELKSHFKKILDTKYSNFYLYNNPNLFFGNNISPEILKELKEHPNLLGIKDSSANIDNYKGYLELLDEDFSVLCGTEADSAKFIRMVPFEKRKYCGLVPSISNLVKISAIIYDIAVRGMDEELDRLQSDLEFIRTNIYDMVQPKGMQQRGLKYAFSNFYEDLISIPIEKTQTVVPEFKREIESKTKERIFSTLIFCSKSNYIVRLFTSL